MANPEHLAILKQGVEQWNVWKEEHPGVRPDLSGAKLAGMELDGANLEKANLMRADLEATSFSEANLSGADLRGAGFFVTYFCGANLTGADLRDGNLSRAFFDGANLSGATLINAYLHEAKLDSAILRQANLRGADLYGAYLNEADLSGAKLDQTNFKTATLCGANLEKASLYEANLAEVDARSASFCEANLGDANLYGANLTEADLRRSKLGGANLTRADLNRANFTDAEAAVTVFASVDLSVARGLEATKHYGPSSLGIDTIYKSGGKIPDVFLRGCGLQDWEIELIKLYHLELGPADLTTVLYRVSELRSGNSIRYSSCFISYSTKDQEFADLLYADLQSKGVRCWFAPQDIHGGRKIHEQLDEAIRFHDKLLLILSENSMTSKWVKTEIANAREREEREKKQMLFPITLAPFESVKNWKLFDADRGIDSAREIREYFIPDFSNWKDHNAYQKAFQRLVSDLKAERRQLRSDL